MKVTAFLQLGGRRGGGTETGLETGEESCDSWVFTTGRGCSFCVTCINPQQPCEEGYVFSIIIPILQMRKLRYREIKTHVQHQSLLSATVGHCRRGDAAQTHVHPPAEGPTPVNSRPWRAGKVGANAEQPRAYTTLGVNASVHLALYLPHLPHAGPSPAGSEGRKSPGKQTGAATAIGLSAGCY